MFEYSQYKKREFRVNREGGNQISRNAKSRNHSGRTSMESDCISGFSEWGRRFCNKALSISVSDTGQVYPFYIFSRNIKASVGMDRVSDNNYTESLARATGHMIGQYI